MKKTEKLGNEGYSLIELIIVVIIIVVIGSFTFMGISLVTSKPADECANKIRIALENNRITTMGKLSSSLKFYVDSEGRIVVKEIIDGSQKVSYIGTNGVTVTYKYNGVADMIVLGDEANCLTVQFDRSSGSLKPQSGGTYDGKYLEKFIISRGTRQLEVKIDRLTGKVTLN